MIKEKNTKKKFNEEEIVSPSKLMVQRFFKNKLAVVGLVIFSIIVLSVLGIKLYTVVTNYDLANIDIGLKYIAPSSEYIFGTDEFGRDYFPRVFLGGFLSLQIGFIAAIISVTIGLIVGGTAGFYGGRVENLLMRLTEIFSSFPFLPIAITVSAVFIDLDPQLRLFFMMFIIGGLGWTGLARMIRAQILSLREQEFMTACRALGIKPLKQITRHLIPNTIAYVIVNATTSFSGAILSEASLAYLGLSVSEPIPTWGGLIQGASTSIVMRNYPWMWIFPGILLFLLILSVNLIGEGMRDAVDPKAHVKFRTQEKESLVKKLFGSKEKNKTGGAA